MLVTHAFGIDEKIAAKGIPVGTLWHLYRM